ATVRSAVAAALEVAGDLPILAGGKSMGGRMTSMAAAKAPLDSVRALVFLGFPLHAAGKPAVDRAEHLSQVTVPMLFLQGTRDKLAELELLRPVCTRLGERATLHVIDGGDHSFHVLRRSGRSEGQVIAELGQTIAGWASRLGRHVG
ncbi:MAG: alpha/beta hydrolase, partial [Acidobacteria bacterium]